MERLVILLAVVVAVLALVVIALHLEVLL